MTMYNPFDQKSAAERMMAQRSAEVDELFKEFTELSELTRTITLSNFVKYAPLFQKRNDEGKSVADKLNEKKYLSNLKMEWTTVVDIYSDINVVDDADHTKVLLTIPKELTRVKEIDQDYRQEIDNYVSHNTRDNTRAAMESLAGVLIGFKQGNKDIYAQKDTLVKEHITKQLKALHQYNPNHPIFETIREETAVKDPNVITPKETLAVVYDED